MENLNVEDIWSIQFGIEQVINDLATRESYTKQALKRHTRNMVKQMRVRTTDQLRVPYTVHFIHQTLIKKLTNLYDDLFNCERTQPKLRTPIFHCLEVIDQLKREIENALIDCECKCNMNYNLNESTREIQKRITGRETVKHYQRSRDDREYVTQRSYYNRPRYKVSEHTPMTMSDCRLVHTGGQGLQLARSEYARPERDKTKRIHTDMEFHTAKERNAPVSRDTRWREFALFKNDRLAQSIQSEIDNQLAYEETETAVRLEKAKADLRLKAALRRLNLSNRGVELAREHNDLIEHRFLYELENGRPISTINDIQPNKRKLPAKEIYDQDRGGQTQPHTKASVKQHCLRDSGTQCCDEYDDGPITMFSLGAPGIWGTQIGKT